MSILGLRITRRVLFLAIGAFLVWRLWGRGRTMGGGVVGFRQRAEP